jgi:peptidoglycan hydrolase-like protein with peptidoglycan-binding domain
MKRIKSLVAGLIVFGLLSPVAAFAEVSTSTITAQLQAIKALREQIAVLQTQQQQNVTTLITTLRQGSNGDAVKTLQALLAADPSIYPEGNISGFFGSLTAKAVKRFQKKHGLEQVGNVGPKTLEKLRELLKDHPMSFENSTSTGDREDHGKRPCAIVPPGHLIAPGWLRKNNGEKPVVPPCQTIPKGIEDREDRDEHRSTTTPPVQDVIAPIISNVSVTGIATTSAAINWSTNENAMSRVYYSQATPVNLSTSGTVVNNSLVINHTITLTGLTGATTYYYVVESRDAFSNTATTSTQSFMTTN